jgi:hypothetical protein
MASHHLAIKTFKVFRPLKVWQKSLATNEQRLDVVKLSASCLKNWSAIASAIACTNS